jgi:hypothetical protein
MRLIVVDPANPLGAIPEMLEEVAGPAHKDV